VFFKKISSPDNDVEHNDLIGTIADEALKRVGGVSYSLVNP
jgi:hypothetical protein